MANTHIRCHPVGGMGAKWRCWPAKPAAYSATLIQDIVANCFDFAVTESGGHVLDSLLETPPSKECDQAARNTIAKEMTEKGVRVHDNGLDVENADAWCSYAVTVTNLAFPGALKKLK